MIFLEANNKKNEREAILEKTMANYFPKLREKNTSPPSG